MKTASCLPLGTDRERLCAWLLVAGRSRDSDLLEESNFDCILAHLGGESDTVEVVRFGHWAVGWVEEILVHPARHAEVHAVQERLDRYPVWNEDDFSLREHTEALNAWDAWGCREFALKLQTEYELRDSTVEYLTKHPSDVHYVFENTSPYVLLTEGSTVRSDTAKLDRSSLARLLRAVRTEIRDKAAI